MYSSVAILAIGMPLIILYPSVLKDLAVLTDTFCTRFPFELKTGAGEPSIYLTVIKSLNVVFEIGTKISVAI